MAINEQILTGRKWRRLIDKTAGLWQRISYWTHSSDVEFNDGKNAETKVGAIDGITDSLVSTSSNIAASAKALSQVNNNLNGNILTYNESEDSYYIQHGADAVPKKLGSVEFKSIQQSSSMYWSGNGNPKVLTVNLSSVTSNYSELVLWKSLFVGIARYNGNCDVAVSTSYNSSNGTLTISMYTISQAAKPQGVYGFVCDIYYLSDD